MSTLKDAYDYSMTIMKLQEKDFKMSTDRN